MTVDLDIPGLLAPFDGESRGGIDLREDADPNNDYRKIRDARSDARDEERQADLRGESSAEAVLGWRNVWSDGQNYLQNQAKDLEVVAYMIEASVRLGGFSGLAQSLSLTSQLIRDFWGEILPAPDEDGIETTLLPISRLNGDIISYALMRVPVTEDTAVGEFLVWQHGQAKQLQSLGSEEREQRIERGAVAMETFTRAVAETSDAFYQNLSAEIDLAAVSLAELQELLESQVDEEHVPNLSRFSGGLEEAKDTLRQIAGDRISVVDATAADDETTGAGLAGEAGSNSEQAVASGEIGSRDQAFDLLEKVARWFERYEPQSILPSEIRKAKRRGQMSPEELYVDLISDEDALRKLFKDVGIQASSSSSSDSDYN
jgi:type VI secretion system protein ImpA